MGKVAGPLRWWALAVLSLAQFMLVLNATVVNVALPSIERDLGASPAGLAWVVNGYALTFGGLLLLGGGLADFFGRRRAFLAGLGVFAFASVAAGVLVPRFGARPVMSGGPIVAAAGLALLSGVSANGSYLEDLFPGMLVVPAAAATGGFALSLGVAAGVLAVAALLAYFTAHGEQT